MVSIKIGITGLPKAGKTAVLEKVISMIEKEGPRNPNQDGSKLVGGMITKPILEKGDRVGFKVINYQTGEEGVMAHVNIDSRHKILGYGIDKEELDAIGVAAIRDAMENYGCIVIDEVGKLEVESENFVSTVREALELGKPILLTLHKKSRNPLLQDIRRRDDARILEVSPVNRNLLPYKILKLLKGEPI